MRYLYLILIFSFTTALSYGQNNPGIWLEVDGSYWQTDNRSSNFNSFTRERSGSLRPMIGYKWNDRWGLGVMGNFLSYREKIDPISGSYAIYSNEPDENGNYPVIAYNEKLEESAISNELKGFGIFLRRYVKLGKKTSLNFNLYGIREKGKNGSIQVYPDYYPCALCLSVIPGPYSVSNPIIETNWKFGIDAAFAYQATSWMAVELRANLMEFRRRVIQDNAPPLLDPGFGGTYYDFFPLMGSTEDFGSAVKRDGIRLGLVFQPFW
ncbi:hypothetical protein PBT90_17330 [Algoriphagus halophytocola]|uniref:Outer membrane protein beta-barrel domain-containing protein n=1 Tax=Algoriphagus halophytocola TaxID=2991499 RepID=A0ABY6MCS5_9BACT|nr:MULTISPECIES: hypothetical protein [unclassified Algoriphagus]UZD21288.1 hypothetical protein OM944_11465 [Algoriphagus sp. TR-M5]WBL42499.1 hypothetical protein PBT90_17330 [Algoriphagus sp. TR-M9]